MKKLTFLFVFITISVFLFAQGVIQKPLAQKAVKNYKLSVAEYNSYNQLKSAKSTKATGDIIWYDDFSDPSNWTMTHEAGTNDDWSIGTDAGSLTTYTGPIGSTTAYNGFAFINGIQYIISPPPPIINAYITWTGTPIDLTAYPIVILNFQQNYRAFNSDEVYVEISNDNVNWTSYDIKGDLPANDFADDQISLNVSTIVGGSSTVWIRFHFLTTDTDPNYGCGYGWMVDDVSLVGALNNDLKLEDWLIDFFFLDNGYFHQIPRTQAEAGPIGFRAPVFNNGNNEQTNVILNVKALSGSNTVFNENSAPPVNIPISVTPPDYGRDTLELDSVLIANQVGDYQIIYNVTKDIINDDLSINTATINFTVSDSVYARDNGIVTGSVSSSMWAGEGNNGDLIGVAYDVIDSSEVNSISVFIHENTEIGTSILARLYHYDTIAGDWIQILTSALYDIDNASKINTWVTIPFTSTDILDAGSYIAAIEIYFEGFDFWIGEDVTTKQEAYSTRWNFSSDPGWWYLSNYNKTPMIRLNFAVEYYASINYTNISCFGETDGSATANGNFGTPSYTYQWSTASTNQTINNLSAGVYNVTVTDNAALTDVAFVTIIEPAAISIVSEISEDVTCNGGNNGTINITVSGGTSPIEYSVNSGANFYANNGFFTGLAAATYNIVVQDANGCSVTGSSIVINEPAALIVDSIIGTDVSCFGDQDGAIDLTVSGGTVAVDYTYQWDDPFTQTTEDLNFLSGDVYCVTVTDDNLCTITSCVTITEPTLIEIEVINTIDVAVFGDSTGAINIGVTGGTFPYTYLWSNDSTTQDILNLTYGTYSVTVTDASGCTATELGIQIFQPPDPSCTLYSTISGVAVSCYGDTDGEATVSGNDGTLPYKYLWDSNAGGQTTSTATGLARGIYYVTVIDDTIPPCWVVDFIEILEPDTISIGYTTTDAFSGGIGGGTATANPTGGTPPYTAFVWSNTQTTQTATNLNAVTYSVTVTDANGCTGVNNNIVVVEITCTLAAVISTSSVTNVSCNGGNDGEATVTITISGVPPYSYEWNNDPGQTNATSTNLTGDITGETNSVVVTDSMHCTATAYVTITEPTPILITILGLTDVSAPGANDGAINIGVSGGTPMYTYFWQPGDETTQDISGLSPDWYTIYVTDANDCTVDSIIVISITSINEVDNDDVISIYPNPTKGKLFIKNAENAAIYIYNIIGEELVGIDNSKKSELFSVDISSLAEGTYLVKIVTDKYVITRKINLIK